MTHNTTHNTTHNMTHNMSQKIRLRHDLEDIDYNTGRALPLFYEELGHHHKDLFPAWAHSSDLGKRVYAPLEDALVASALLAWNNHKAVRFSPDHFWNAILRAFSSYLQVDGNDEKYRKFLVPHDGKKDIIVRIDEILNETNDTEKWGEYWVEGVVKAMNADMLNNVVDITTGVFSTSTSLTQTCNSMCVMQAFSSYYRYECMSSCGLPMVYLEGIEEDWQQLLEKTRVLRKFCSTAGMDLDWYFNDIKEPLDNLLATYQASSRNRIISSELGSFWQQIISDNERSGATCYDGWIIKFIAFDQYGRRRRERMIDTIFASSYVRGDFIRNHDGFKTPHCYVGGLVGVDYIEPNCYPGEDVGSFTPAFGWFLAALNEEQVEVAKKDAANAKKWGPAVALSTEEELDAEMIPWPESEESGDECFCLGLGLEECHH